MELSTHHIIAEVISNSSLTNIGQRTDSTETNVQYFLQGEHISIPAEPSYLKSEKYASGSSVATALATAISVLTISCRRLGDGKKEIERIKTVRTAFDRMTLPEKDKYVKPWTVLRMKSWVQWKGCSG